MEVNPNNNKLQKISDYIRLIEKFISEKIDAAAFEREFLMKFKADSTLWESDVFETLEQLFSDVDAFCEEPSIRGEGDLDESQLREQSKIALQKLRQIYININ